MSGESNNSEMRAIRTRLDFSKIPTSIQIPNLIEVQRRSYERFLQMDKLPQEREDNGLQSVFTSVFPITDFRNVSELEFVDYSIGNWECKCGYLKGLNHLRTACTHCGHMVITDPFHPGDVLCNFCGTYNKNTPDFCTKCGDPVGLQLKYDQAECEERGMTYSAPLKVTIRLKIYDKDPETGVKSLRDMKEQEVFFGDIPLMSANGTFIVNGTERVIVSQLHRSPGVFFETANNRTYFLGKIIPYRGSWVEFEYDQKNTLYVRIDRKRKFLGTIFLRALGLRTDEEILKTFYTVDTINVKDGKLSWKVVPEGTPTNLQGTRPAHAIMAKGEELAPATRKISAHSLKGLRSHKIEAVEVETSEFDGAMTAADVVDLTTGELLYEANQELTADKLHKIHAVRRHQLRGLLPRARRRGQHHHQHASPRLRAQARGSADRDLPQAASRRPTDARHRDGALRRHVLRSAQVRLLARRPSQVQHQAVREPGPDRPRQAHADARGLLRHHSLPAQAAQEHRHRR